MASDLQTVSFIFMRKYADSAEDVAQRMHPLFARIPKRGDFVGDSFSYFVRHTNPQGIGGTLAGAIAASNTSKGKQLRALRFSKYGVIDLDCEAIAACATKGAIYDLVTLETDGILDEMGADFAFDLYHTQAGIRGQRASISGNIVTLVTPDDARNFHEGMTVTASTNADGITGLRVGSTTVAATDEQAGTITLTSAAAITSFADNDFLARATTPGTCMEGLELLNPLAAPVFGSDSFRGIDRGSNVPLLSGCRLNDTTLTVAESTGRIAIAIANNKRRATEAYVNPVNFWAEVRRANGKVVYDNGGGNATYAFETFEVATPAGTIKLVSDPDCPLTRIRLVNNEKHYLKHLGGLPHIVMEDGLQMLRGSNTDTVQARVRGRLNYFQTDPGCFGVGSQ
jgi:hypothetical protein